MWAHKISLFALLKPCGSAKHVTELRGKRRCDIRLVVRTQLVVSSSSLQMVHPAYFQYQHNPR
jgi:hypothetical protein